MATATEQLINMSVQRSSGDLDEAALDDLRFRAATERLEEQRKTIPVLDQRAKAVGVDTITSRADLAPLLFAHSNYKSYPESFIKKGQWNRMSVWLNTIASADITAIDIDGVRDIDEWVDRLNAAGVHLWVSSGTSGKCSFLPVGLADLELNREVAHRGAQAWPTGLPVSILAPSTASMKYSYAWRATAEAVGDPDDIVYLSDKRMRIADSLRRAEIRNAMISGSATPGDVAEFEAETAGASNDREAEIEAMTDRILSLRDRPQFIYGFWAPLWRIMQIAKDRGVSDGTFHPGTIVVPQGGLKGLDLPLDYVEQASAFFGSTQIGTGYGMTELAFAFPKCSEGRYHPSPALTLMILDESGENLLEPGADGIVVGRVAIYDPGHEGHWGGIVTGDKVTADLNGDCACGRPGAAILEPIERYSELGGSGGDDKLTCGGTINEYIRSAVAG